MKVSAKDLHRKSLYEGVDLWNRIIGPRGDANRGTGYTLKESHGSDDPGGLFVAPASETMADEQMPQVTRSLEVPAYRYGDDPEFDAWFDESLVTDADGSPVPLYHGTANPNVDTLRVTKGDSLQWGPGIYLTESRNLAEIYAQGSWRTGASAPNGKVLTVYARIMHPLDGDVPAHLLPDSDVQKVHAALQATGHGDVVAAVAKFSEEPLYQRLSFLLRSGDEATRVLREAGYDGLRIRSDGDVWVAFDAEQLRNAARAEP